MEARFEGKRVHVIGLGAWGTGRAVARALRKRGAEVTVSDTKPAHELAREIEALAGMRISIQTGANAYRGIEDAELVVPSPGVPLTIPPIARARERGATVVSEIEVAYWLASCPLLAVTGTKGKTTTTTLIGELLHAEGRNVFVGGNIGRPLVELAEVAGPGDLLVAEVSSFQLEATVHFHPKAAALLNLAPDHLDRHGNLTNYEEAKARLFANQTKEDVAVINRDDPGAWKLRDRTDAQVWAYSLVQPEPEGGDLVEGWLRVAGERVCEASALRLRGRHNRANALAALLVARGAGATLKQAASVLANFRGVEHRLEEVAEVGGALYINDSQATTPDSAVAGLEAFEEHVILIAGGRPKVHDFSVLGEAVANRGAALILIGEAADEIAAAAQAAGADDITRATSLAEAMRLAREKARPGDVVLMSPACASFDMFANMAERGRTFKALVTELMMKGSA